MPRTKRPQRPQHPPARPLLERGVWCPPVLTEEGFPFLVMVNRYGCQVGERRPIYPFESESDVFAELRAVLDEMDPAGRN